MTDNPINPIVEYADVFYDFQKNILGYRCPCCNKLIHRNEPVCVCGQQINWAGIGTR